jgi:hypothetical protein
VKEDARVFAAARETVFTTDLLLCSLSGRASFSTGHHEPRGSFSAAFLAAKTTGETKMPHGLMIDGKDKVVADILEIKDLAVMNQH